MSKIGSVILEIQELYYAGFSAKEISIKTNTTVDFVNGVISGLK